jgi:AAA ATPase domain
LQFTLDVKRRGANDKIPAMKLIEAQVRNFRNILDSTPVAIRKDITCLVGKNESGKTAFLHALYRLQPARPNVKFAAHEQYPAWLEKRDRQKGVDIEAFRPIRAVFEFESEDLLEVENRFGKGTVTSGQFTLQRNYEDALTNDLALSEKRAVKNAVDGLSFPSSVAANVKKAETFDSLRELATEYATEDDDELKAAGTAIAARLNELLGSESLSDVVWKLVEPKIPEFFYYAEYSNLPYSIRIRELLTAKTSALNDGELTARALLRLAGAENDYLLNPDYERRKRELENVANALTDDVLKYWSQNPDLRVEPDITLKTVPSQNAGQTTVVDELKIRIRDQRHSLSLPFDQHSTGFRWFFSFLAAFSEYEFKDAPVVILLDEPAVGLHAKAQADFLRFIEERLAPRCQVIYTTHSPFMVQPGRLERARLVEDRGRIDGAVVTSDVLTTDRDTIFPLQGALGYDMAQHLFIAPHNLVVEGTSDYTYLVVLSDHLRSLGRTGLDERWSIVPVGGADYIPTFVALLGHHLNVTVLVDSQKAGHQRLSHLAQHGYLSDKRIITNGEIAKKALADIEDLFAPEDYLMLFNAAFKTKLTARDLKGTDQILSQIERAHGSTFDHGRPADILLRRRDEFLPKLTQTTLDNFDVLNARVNGTLGK